MDPVCFLSHKYSMHNVHTQVHMHIHAHIYNKLEVVAHLSLSLYINYAFLIAHRLAEVHFGRVQWHEQLIPSAA